MMIVADFLYIMSYMYTIICDLLCETGALCAIVDSTIITPKVGVVSFGHF